MALEELLRKAKAALQEDGPDAEVVLKIGRKCAPRRDDDPVILPFGLKGRFLSEEDYGAAVAVRASDLIILLESKE